MTTASPLRGRVRRWVLAAAAGAVAIGAVVPAMSILEPAPAHAQAVADRSLERQAVSALKQGQWDKTEQLIREAVETRPGDERLQQMLDWVVDFREQRQQFQSERREAFEQQISDVHLLLDNGYRSYAITALAGAYLLADDKDAFVAEPWVRELIDESARLGAGYEQHEEWLKALRVYSDLGSIEPLNPLWKEKLKDATRRVRLLAVYAPETLEELRDSTEEERDAVEKLLESNRPEKEEDTPTTQPTEVVDPTAESAEEGAKDNVEGAAGAAENPQEEAAVEELDDAFKTDWHKSLRGVRMSMLQEALVDAQKDYVRDVEYRELVLGGLQGVRALATTNGLEKAFPSLEQAEQRQKFIDVIDSRMQSIREGDRVDADTLTGVLRMISSANDESLKLPGEVIVSEFADGALSKLDPFSNMIWPSDVEEFNKSTQGEFVGVGIRIKAEPTGELTVVSPLPDSPAYRAGISAHDVITHIDGKSAKGISDTQAVKSITGRPGTTVTLTIKSPDGTVRDVPLRREQITIESVKGWKQLPGGGWEYFADPASKIGYLRLTQFQKSSGQELADALAKLEREGARAVILDLRNNPGGLLGAAVQVSDLFLQNGRIVSTRADKLGSPEVPIGANRDPDDVKLPLIVLVNQYSASASEIVSGALKDQNRALVVGERTFGKGSVQMLYRLGRGDAYLKLTTSHYYLPSGRNIHRDDDDVEWGVDPDVLVEMTPTQMRDAILARQELDVLVDPAEAKNLDPAELEKLENELLDSDAQLATALLLLRLQLAGAPVM